MKRLFFASLAAAFLFAAGTAQAVDVKVKGSFNFVYVAHDGTDFIGDNGEKREQDGFFVKQRVRTQVDFIASEYVKGVVQFEIGDIFWGRGGTEGPGSGGALDSDGVNVETKHAYLDFLVPNTELSVRMGLQYLPLPMGTGYTNPVFSADVAGIVTSYKFNEMFGLTAFWARPFDRYDNDDKHGGVRSLDDEVDMFGLVAPVTGDGWSVTPWFVYANVGSASGMYEYIAGYRGRMQHYTGYNALSYEDNDRASAWWLGGAFSMNMLDPLVFGLDVMYGDLGRNTFGLRNAKTGAVGPVSDIETQGWFITAKLDYKLDWAVPGIFGWWSSGDDAKDAADGKFGRIPTVGMDDGFSPTSFGLSGNYLYGYDAVISSTGAGTWGVGLQVADLSFVQDLSHLLRVAYYKGTNDHEMVGNALIVPLSGEKVYMTDKDSAWEVNFDHFYKVYPNLTVYLELGYINLDMDEDVWGKDTYGDDAFRGQLGFVYSF